MGKVRRFTHPFATLIPKRDIKLKVVCCQHWAGFPKVTTFMRTCASPAADGLMGVKWALSL